LELKKLFAQEAINYWHSQLLNAASRFIPFTASKNS